MPCSTADGSAVPSNQEVMRTAVQRTRVLAQDDDPDEERSDSELIQRIGDDPTAFAALYQRHAPQVFWYLRSRTESLEEAADLTQEAFLRCYTALPRYQDRRLPFRAWLFRVVRNLAIDAARRRRRQSTHEASDPVPIPSPPLPEAIILQHEEATELRALIAQLDPDKQELLALHFAAGLSIAEIAAVRGKSEWATRKQLQRTIARLRDAYGRNEDSLA
jgi:RNA polymerase sigma-70 factor (ECF subfamily)